jgi:MarR family transcriptional repressor of emrRAB
VSDSFQPFEHALRELARRLPGTPRREAILTRLIQLINARINESADAPLREFGLNQTTFTALGVLYGSPGYTRKPSELSVFMISSRTNITRVADDLVRKGLVARVPDETDRRQLNLTLTRKGRETIRKILPRRRRQLAAQWAPLARAEQDDLERLQRKLLASLDG